MLEFRNISKTFLSGTVKHQAVSNLNLTIKEGEFFSLLGPSGCGKTTLLRMIAGFEFPTEGGIYLKGQRVDTVPAQHRPFNMVFQRYALFPHLNVFENVAFGLRMRKKSEKMAASEIKDRVEHSLQLVNMLSFQNRLPETLSGGQSQRIAIARALVNQPQILLLDEPLSALDQKLREHMQTELKDLQRKLGLTFIYVTHDQEEALALSDRVGVMNHGRLEQVSEPKNLYDDPSTLFAAQFVGPMTTLECEFMEVEGHLAKFKMGDLILKANPRMNTKNQGACSAIALIRPEKMRLTHVHGTETHLNRLSGKVTEKIFRGTQTEVIVKISERFSIRAIITDDELDDQLSIGLDICVSFDPKDTFLFQGATS